MNIHPQLHQELIRARTADLRRAADQARLTPTRESPQIRSGDLRPARRSAAWVRRAASRLRLGHTAENRQVPAPMSGSSAAPHLGRVLATILFTDIVDSTNRLIAVGDLRWRALLDQHDAAVLHHLERHLGTHVKGTGDGVLATFETPSRAIACAFQIRAAVCSMGLNVRAGIHTGEVEQRGADVTGVAVHLAARLAALATAGEILVSRTVIDLVVGSGIQFEDCGEHELKGMPEPQRLFAAVDWHEPESCNESQLVMSP